MLELTEISLYLRQLPRELEGVRILHISDLHIRGYGPREQRLDEVMRQGCDLLLCTGDCCSELSINNPFYMLSVYYGQQDGRMDHGGQNRQGNQRYRLSWRGFTFPCLVRQAGVVVGRLLSDLQCETRAVFVQGNHDPDDFIAQLSQLGVTVLANETMRIDLPGRCAINICGLQNYCRMDADIPKALIGCDSELFSIGICHFPEMSEPLGSAGIDLVLAGHTHGGQVCLPGRRPLVTHSCTGVKYASGLERLGESVIYTNRGLGYSGVPIRWNCPAEITRLTLRVGSHSKTTITRKVL